MEEKMKNRLTYKRLILLCFGNTKFLMVDKTGEESFFVVLHDRHMVASLHRSQRNILFSWSIIREMLLLQSLVIHIVFSLLLLCPKYDPAWSHLLHY